jgi:hypothetical protein
VGSKVQEFAISNIENINQISHVRNKLLLCEDKNNFQIELMAVESVGKCSNSPFSGKLLVSVKM